MFKYVKDENLVKRVKKLISEGKEATSFGYNKDLSGNFKRSLYVFLYNINHFKKYKKYLG